MEEANKKDDSDDDDDDVINVLGPVESAAVAVTIVIIESVG